MIFCRAQFEYELNLCINFFKNPLPWGHDFFFFLILLILRGMTHILITKNTTRKSLYFAVNKNKRCILL